MDLQKAKIFLEKINREFNRMVKEPENIARIDVDIICAYTREMYDAFLSEKTTVPVVSKPAAPSRPESAPAPPPAPVEFTPERPAPKPRREPEMEVPAPVPPTPPTYVAPAPPPQVVPPAPVQAPPPVVVSAPAPPPPVQQTAPASPPPVVVAAPSTVPVASFSGNPEAELLFEEKKARELSEKLAQTRIPDLTRAFGVNDRLLYAKELFAGNAQAFNDAVAAINQLANFEYAKVFLLERCVQQFDWTHKSRQAFAKDFIQLVRRRFN